MKKISKFFNSNIISHLHSFRFNLFFSFIYTYFYKYNNTSNKPMFRPENRRSKKKKSKISNRLSFSRENFPSVTSPSSSKTNREGRFNYSVTVQLSMIFSTAAINETLHNGTLQRVTRVGNTHFLRVSCTASHVSGSAQRTCHGG